MKKQRNKEKESKHNLTFWLDLLPLVLLFSVQPLVMIGKEVKTYLSDQPWFPSEPTQYDFFMYGKMAVFLVLAVWITVVVIDRIAIRREKPVAWKRFLPLALYEILAVLSACCSLNQELSLHGMNEQYETVWVLLGYGLVAFGAAQIIKTERQLKVSCAALCVGAGIQGLLGLAQLLGHDFFSTAIGKKLLTAGLGKEVAETMYFTFSGSSRNRVYMALYNPNYAGVYVVLLLPIVLALTCLAQKLWQRLASLMIAVLLMVGLVGSGSRTGMAVVAVQILLVCILCPKAKKRKMAVLLYLIVILGIGTVLQLSGGHITRLLKSFQKQKEYKVQELEVSGTKVHLNYMEEEVWLDIGTEGENLVLQAEGAGGEVLPVTWESERQRFWIKKGELKRWSFEVFWQEGIYFLMMHRAKTDWCFAKKTLNGEFTYVTQYGKADRMEVAPTAFPGYEKVLSGRGYIWGRTLPLLPAHLLIGTGEDTFVQAFPQSDYIGKYHAGERMLKELPAKAHSLYLQSALQTGVLSLVMLLVFWGWYIRDAVKCRKKISDKRHRFTCLAFLLGISGYLLMGLLNDSNLATAPVFWGILGMGIAANQMYIPAQKSR